MKKIVFLIVLFCISLVSAQDGLKRTLERYQKQPVELTYELEVYWSVRERTNKRSGTALFTADDKFSVTLGRHLWVCNGDTVWNYSKRRRQVTLYALNRAPFEMPGRLFKFLLETPFETEKKGNNSWVARWKSPDATPRNGYLEAELNYNDATQEVASIQLVDIEGNRFTYNIESTTFHTSVPEGTFSFEIPEGVEIIEKM